MLVDASARIRE